MAISLLKMVFCGGMVVWNLKGGTVYGAQSAQAAEISCTNLRICRHVFSGLARFS